MKLFGAGRPDHPMADPKEAKRLLDELPAQDPLKALEELAHWHESLAAAEGFKPEVRIQLHFNLDEAAQARLRKASRDYIAARASRFQENRIWTSVYGYHRHAAEAYSRSVDAIAQGAKGADAAKPLLPLLLARTLRNLAQQSKWLHLRYGPIDTAIWRALNGVYAFAEARSLADAKVATLYAGAPGESSPRLEFLRAAMLNLSSPDSLMPSEVDLAERLIGENAASCLLANQGGAGLTHWIDLGQAMAPVRLAKLPEAAPGLRFLGAGPAVAALQGLAKRIAASGGTPSNLEADPETTNAVIEHLLLYWSAAAPERKHPRHSVKGKLSIMSGFGGVIGALESSGPSDALSAAPEDWVIENVSAGGFGAVVPPSKSDWLKIGSLLAMQPDGGKNWVVGTVRRVSKTAAKETRVGIETLSRTPELARFALRAGEETGVILPSLNQGEGEAAIALRAGVFVPGQNLENARGGRSYVYMPQGVSEHGDDYDIVRFREMVRETESEH